MILYKIPPNLPRNKCGAGSFSKGGTTCVDTYVKARRHDKATKHAKLRQEYLRPYDSSLQ